MTENELHTIMRQAMIAGGAEDVWLAIGSGRKGYGIFNSYPTDYELREGDLIWVDGGAYFGGYVCDFIRSVVIASPSDEQVAWYEAALQANRVGVSMVKSGARCTDIFAAVREYLDSVGLAGAWGLDVLGHGVGVEIHELPSIGADSELELVSGNVVTIEPSLSPPGHEHGHYIVEEVVAVTADGGEILTDSLPGDLWVTT
jgi:Xaa-Pro aminopeptidase